jgi:hypothetical protein
MQATVDSSRDRPRRSHCRSSTASRWRRVHACRGLCGPVAAGWWTRGWVSAWPRFADDAYYYLVIAGNAAAGHGFTMDRISPTNGFQPLWMAARPLAGSGGTPLSSGGSGLCVALFAITGGPPAGAGRSGSWRCWQAFSSLPALPERAVPNRVRASAADSVRDRGAPAARSRTAPLGRAAGRCRLLMLARLIGVRRCEPRGVRAYRGTGGLMNGSRNRRKELALSGRRSPGRLHSAEPIALATSHRALKTSFPGGFSPTPAPEFAALLCSDSRGSVRAREGRERLVP